MPDLILNRLEVCRGLACPKCGAGLSSSDGILTGERDTRLEFICSRCHTTALKAELEAETDPWE